MVAERNAMQVMLLPSSERGIGVISSLLNSAEYRMTASLMAMVVPTHSSVIDYTEGVQRARPTRAGKALWEIPGSCPIAVGLCSNHDCWRIPGRQDPATCLVATAPDPDLRD